MTSWSAFYCYRTRHVFIASDIKKTNKEYLESLDYSYFESIANLVASEFTIDSEDQNSEFEHIDDSEHDKNHLAILARASLYQAAEAAILVSGMFLQAPHAPGAYASQFSPDCCRGVALAIKDEGKLPNVRGIKQLASADVLKAIVEAGWPQIDREPRDVQQFYDLMAYFAGMICDDDLRREHNSFKHGLRVRSGGSSIVITPTRPTGEISKNAESIDLSSSFGSHAQEFTDIGLSEDKKTKTLWPESISRSWVLRSVVECLHLSSSFLQNFSSLMLISNGVAPKDTKFTFPADRALYESHRARQTAMTRFSFSMTAPSREDGTISVELVDSALKRAYERKG